MCIRDRYQRRVRGKKNFQMRRVLQRPFFLPQLRSSVILYPNIYTAHYRCISTDKDEINHVEEEFSADEKEFLKDVTGEELSPEEEEMSPTEKELLNDIAASLRSGLPTAPELQQIEGTTSIVQHILKNDTS
eukprot:TRINITY_DN20680_c0_g1_i1.p1 TRINITY_DN20680_c0_g1~~TRINITY_DN20680_c0_g1_i1.p1  ORF type:complete len:132 (-),score=33.44 TRINITY_DN20680_c0_g1_i1:49-444(-)